MELTVLKMDLATARQEYPTASDTMKKIFEKSFPEGSFSTNIIDRVKTMDDVFLELRLDKEQFYKNCFGLTEDEVAYREVKLIAQALNEGWIPDWGNTNQSKWRPWFYMTPGGFRFYVSYCGTDYSVVGSRLCYKSEKLSDYAAKTFSHIYEKLFTA